MKNEPGEGITALGAAFGLSGFVFTSAWWIVKQLDWFKCNKEELELKRKEGAR